MSDKKPIQTDIAEAVFILCIFVVVVLSAGRPDLLDAILYKLTDGAYKLPGTEEVQK